MLVNCPDIDRRYYPRVKVRLSCGMLTTSTEAPGPCVGSTKNISRRGLLIRWTRDQRAPNVPQVGDRLGVELAWPLGTRSLQCWGRVVRVSPGAGAPLVAVAVYRMGFSASARRKPVASDVSTATGERGLGVAGYYQDGKVTGA